MLITKSCPRSRHRLWSARLKEGDGPITPQATNSSHVRFFFRSFVPRNSIWVWVSLRLLLLPSGLHRSGQQDGRMDGCKDRDIHPSMLCTLCIISFLRIFPPSSSFSSFWLRWVIRICSLRKNVPSNWTADLNCSLGIPIDRAFLGGPTDRPCRRREWTCFVVRHGTETACSGRC